MTTQPICAAVLTPAGRSAIAVVQVSGDYAAAVVDSLFHSANGKPIVKQPIGRICFGHWEDAAGEEVVACRRETCVEIHCHGGAAAVRAICESLRKAGCKLAEPAEWKMDPLRADAQRALAQATTERTALILLDQYNGVLAGAMENAVNLIHAGNNEHARAILRSLIDNWSVGKRLTEPARIVLTGAPNVGKSSLINALVGFERAIVFDQPGTTRDAVTVRSAIDGWPVEFIDTAGLREVDCELERAGVARARDAIASADLVLEVTEATDWLSGAKPSIFLGELLEPSRLLSVANKIDLLVEKDRKTLWRTNRTPISTSALTGEGVEELLHQIANRIAPLSLPPGKAIPFRKEQVVALQLADECLEQSKPDAALLALRAMQACPKVEQSD